MPSINGLKPVVSSTPLFIEVLSKLRDKSRVVCPIEKFFKFNYENKEKSETSFDLKKRFDLIFNLFDVQGINDFNSKISLIKKQAKLEDNLQSLNINIKVMERVQRNLGSFSFKNEK